MGKSATGSARAALDAPGTSGPLDEAAMFGNITSGASYHASAVRLIGKWALAGVPFMDARARVLAAFDAVPTATRDNRWQTRRADADRCVTDIYGKQARKGDEAADAAGPSKPPAQPPAMSILDRSASLPPELPLVVFGPFWNDWITRAAEGANAPPDYVALPLLALASSLPGNARWVVAWRGWAEPPALWCASVGNPSSGKSSGASPVTRDVVARIEAHVCRDYPRDMQQWETVASVGKAVLKQWEKDTAAAIKSKQAVPDKPPEATIPPKPIRPRARARVVDVTVEKLAAITEGLPKGVLYVRDELAGWLLNLSRYANGGSDRPFWLESYNGGAMQVDRLKNPAPVFIPHLTVPVFGTIQPDRLAEVLGGADDGLPTLRLARVLEYLWWCGDGGDRPEPQRVSLRAIQAAAGLLEAYFLPMARPVLGDASVPADERNARTLATWIIETRPERVNVSSIRDGARLPGLRDSDPVKAACRYLVEARWLTEAPSSGGPGRPRGDFIVNPVVWDASR